MQKKYITPILTATILCIILLIPAESAKANYEPNLKVNDLSGASNEFTYAQILAMPKTVVNADLYCDGALVTYGNWGGVLISYLLTEAQVTPPEIGSVHFVASDQYQVAIPINLAVSLIIAYEKDGESLAEGFRLVVPDANGASWIAEITSITVSIFGAENPQAISVGHSNVAAQPSPTSKQTPAQPQPSTPEKPLSNQVTPTNALTNVPQTSPQATNPQGSTESLNLQTLPVYLIGFACACSIAAATYVALRRKRKQT